MIEEWRDIKGFEGKYQVSNLGRVKQLAFTTYSDKNFRGKYERKERMMDQFTWQSRYLRVDIGYSENKVRYRRATYVHTLVAEAFLGERPDGYEIDHINGDYLDNRAENLRYVTHSDNMNNIDKEAFGKKQSKWLNEKQPCKGRRYVSKDGESKMIHPEEIEEYINNGWHLGFDVARHKHEHRLK